jgi:signal transduction histidine kinase
MPPIDFALSDKEMMATVEKIGSERKEGEKETRLEGVEGKDKLGDEQKQDEEMIRSLLVSNEQPYIHQFQFIFQELWNNGIDAKERIAAIEQGLEQEFLEVIADHKKAAEILVDLARSAKKEVLMLLPNDRAMVRMERLGITNHLIQASHKNGTQIKIICPLSSENEHIVKRMLASAPDFRILGGNNSAHGMIIVDGERFLRAELREPLETEFSNAIGFTIYSNSKPSVESFKSIFELLWNERTLNEELKRADRMQKEFINIAAHELRNPIQPILSITEVLQHSAKDVQERELLEITVRNAKRLRQLTEDILDVSKIESKSLQLNKEQFNLSEMILNCISDFRNQIKNENRDSSLRLEALLSSNGGIQKKAKVEKEKEDEEDILIEADRNRLYQVVSNLLNNAIKFTKEGTIQVSVERKEGVILKKNADGNGDNDKAGAAVVVIGIRDTGGGIDTKILPRLFTKFATSSELGGTRLGLFISKSIVEAHGGKIWAENNIDGKGSGFYFSLPLNRR